MTGSRGVRRTSVLRLATEPTKAAFCITAFVDVNEASLLAFLGLRGEPGHLCPLAEAAGCGYTKTPRRGHKHCLWAAG